MSALNEPFFKKKGEMNFVLLFMILSTGDLIVVIGQTVPDSIPPALMPPMINHISGSILERIERLKASKKGTVSEVPPIAPIINGTDSQEHKYPWQIFLLWLHISETYGSFCGGTIVNERTVMTAGHCVEYDVEQTEGTFYVFAGVHDISVIGPLEQLVFVETVRLHEGFRWSGTYLVRDDIALLITEEPFTFTTIAVQPVPRLSTRISDIWALKANNCVAIGWGLYVQEPIDQTADILQEKTPLNVVTNKKCNLALRKDDLGVTPKMICTLNPDGGTCYGDSGGSLGCYDRRGEYYQIGFTSWGGGVVDGKCDGRGVYVRVSKYCQWITKNMFKV